MLKRNTIQRSLVLETVGKLQCHATAEEIYEAIVHDHPNMSRATVYRNLKLLLWVSGHSDGLNGQEADDFRMILEKSGFGEKGPSNQELRRAVHFYRKLAEEEYGRLPFYKKPVFKCFNVY